MQWAFKTTSVTMDNNNSPTSSSQVDINALLTQTTNMFGNGIADCDVNVAIANVTAWIDFLNQDTSPTAPAIAAMLNALLGHLNALIPPLAMQDPMTLDPTMEDGDPAGPTVSRPKQISRLGTLLAGG